MRLSRSGPNAGANYSLEAAMKRHLKSALTGALLASAAASAFSSETTVHWSYQGKTDPTHWAEGMPENAACRSGRQQSPIALSETSAKRVASKDFTIDYEPGSVALLNNGHTIQANVDDANDTVNYKGEAYKLDQFHFHTPSEHTLDGKSYPMELHLVNKGSNGKITVVGIFIKEGKENPALQPVFADLPATQTSSGRHAQVDIAALLPSDKKALVYSGSLTTPPCSELVNWIVLEQPVEMSRQQISAFKAIFRDNHRPLQKLNHREVGEE
ncbi:eukaryotic-type carbonic anhydrase family protein [Collimonas fungivorans]|uniref:Carbonic anhydrase n=2 Tax=Collimonas fungivorans TaxID=158899 RepID=A0A127PDS1_9BURK|nr:eukaryotic-type carbonic anhydrase family protein [Collimonas fungivorans]